MQQNKKKCIHLTINLNNQRMIINNNIIMNNMIIKILKKMNK